MTEILTPNTNAEAAAIIKDAADKRSPIGIQGGGTKSAIGTPMQVDKTLSSSGLSGITLYEPSEMVIGAKAGTPLAEIEAALTEHDQRLSFDPVTYQRLLGSAGTPTIGALAACNLSGPRRITFGAARDSLIGIEMINGKGEIIKNGGRVMKNVTGYDLTKLVCGSWGTLGLLTEVYFKVQPKPALERTLIYTGMYENDAIPMLCKAMGSPFEITSAAHVNADKRLEDDHEGCWARTMLRIEGFEESLNYRAEELEDLLGDFEFDSVKRVDGAESAALWNKVADLSALNDTGRQLIWKISLKPTNGVQMAAWLRDNLTEEFLCDWSGGLIYAAVELNPDTEWDAGAVDMRKKIAELGGHATLIRAPEDIRANGVSFQPLSKGVAQLTHATKVSFDPYGIFNPGRLYGATY